MNRYRLYELKPKSAVVTEHEGWKTVLNLARKMRDYVIFDKQEDRIIQVSNRTAKE